MSPYFEQRPPRKNHTCKLRFFLSLSLFFISFTAAAKTPLQKVCFKKHCFIVELAADRNSHTKGLMFRDSLEPDGGMLFIFDEQDVYSFWMKNTYIRLDIIWLNKEKEVVFVSKNSQPCLDTDCPAVTPDRRALYVLELNAGVCDNIGLNIGDKLDFTP